MVRSDQYGAIPCNGCHGRERVHALSARDARHQLKRKERDSRLRQIGILFQRRQRLSKTDSHLSWMEERQIGCPSFRIGAEASHLRDHICFFEDVRPVSEAGPARDVCLIREPGLHSSRSLDDDVQTQLPQSFTRARGDRDSTFSWERLARNSNSRRQN